MKAHCHNKFMASSPLMPGRGSHNIETMAGIARSCEDYCCWNSNGKLLQNFPSIFMDMSHMMIRRNDVTEDGSRAKSSSSGMEFHESQVDPDRHHATADRKKQGTLSIGTWNVRTMLQKGKMENVKREMERLHINILGLCETRWTGAGQFTSDNYLVIYSGGEKHEKGVGVILDQKTTGTLKGY